MTAISGPKITAKSSGTPRGAGGGDKAVEKCKATGVTARRPAFDQDDQMHAIARFLMAGFGRKRKPFSLVTMIRTNRPQDLNTFLHLGARVGAQPAQSPAPT